MSLECDDVRERLADLAAGDLDAAEGAAIARHVAGCPACAEARQRVEAILEAARTVPAPALPAHFADRVMEDVKRRERTVRVGRRWRRRAALAASLLVALTALLVLSRAHRPHRGPRESAHLEAIVSGVDSAVRETGGRGRDVLGTVVAAGREALEAPPPEMAEMETAAVETAVADGLRGLDEDLDSLGRAVLRFFEDAERSVPWL